MSSGGVIDHNDPESREQRFFKPSLHIQRHNAVAAIVQKMCRACSVLDVGSSACEFGKFALSPSRVGSEWWNPLGSYTALDVCKNALLAGVSGVDQHQLGLKVQGKHWFPRQARYYAGDVFTLSSPVPELACPRFVDTFEEEHEQEDSKTKDDAQKEGKEKTSSPAEQQQEGEELEKKKAEPVFISHTPHAECIISIDVVEHIPINVDFSYLLTDEQREKLEMQTTSTTDKTSTQQQQQQHLLRNRNGPAAFLDWIFFVAPCAACTRCVVVTTPNSGDNGPILKMPQGERRHWDHKFEWDLNDFATACRMSLRRRGFGVVDEKEDKNNTGENENSSSTAATASLPSSLPTWWRATHHDEDGVDTKPRYAAWIHFGIGNRGACSQGAIALQCATLEEALRCVHNNKNSEASNDRNEEMQNERPTDNGNNVTADDDHSDENNEPTSTYRNNGDDDGLFHALAELWQLDGEIALAVDVHSSKVSRESDALLERRDLVFEKVNTLFEEQVPFSTILRFEILELPPPPPQQERKEQNASTTTTTTQQQHVDPVVISSAERSSGRLHHHRPRHILDLLLPPHITAALPPLSPPSTTITASTATDAAADGGNSSVSRGAELVSETLYEHRTMWGVLYETILDTAQRIANARRRVARDAKRQKSSNYDEEDDFNSRGVTYAQRRRYIRDACEDYIQNEEDAEDAAYYAAAAAAAEDEEKQVGDGDEEEEEEEEEEQKPPEQLPRHLCVRSRNDSDEEEEEEEEWTDERVSIFEIAEHNDFRVEFASVPLFALLLVDPCDIPECVRTCSSLARTFSSGRRHMQHVCRSIDMLTDGGRKCHFLLKDDAAFPILAEKKDGKEASSDSSSLCRPLSWWWSSAGMSSTMREQVDMLLLPVCSTALDDSGNTEHQQNHSTTRKEQIAHKLIWAAVDGFFDGAGVDGESGEKSLWM